MSKKFKIIVADPPWNFKDSLKMSDVARGALANYNTMTISKIKDMPVKDIVDSNGAILALWVPSSLLQEGLDTMKAWGFKHKQTYVWVKVKKQPLQSVITNLAKIPYIIPTDSKAAYVKKIIKDIAKNVKIITSNFNLHDTLAFGMGRLFRQTHEICLIGTSNNKIYKVLANKSQRSVSFGQNLKHSAKPEHLQDSLEIMFPNTEKLELFARRLRPGWECLGNEVCNGEDIYDSLAKLI